jgi:hypothetical protein
MAESREGLWMTGKDRERLKVLHEVRKRHITQCISFTAKANALDTSVDQENFENTCEDLSRRQHMVRRTGSRHSPDGTISQCYEFVHALYQKVFYRRQAPGRRARLRLHIGETAAEAFPLSA